MFGPRHFHRLDLILGRLTELPRGSRVLDAACGLGQLVERLQRKGFRAFGIDGEFAAALHAHRTTRAPIVVGDMTKLPFRGAAFHAITTGETLEHLDDDQAAAAEIARVLERGGRCVATVPAIRALWTASDDYYEHRRRYSRSMPRDTFARAARPRRSPKSRARFDRAFLLAPLPCRHRSRRRSQ